MDYVKNAMGGGDAQSGNNNNGQAGQLGEQRQQQTSRGGSLLGVMSDKFNSMTGGGQNGEKNEDSLDKGIAAVQQHGLGQGKDGQLPAGGQVKDEQVSDFIREKHMSTAGNG